MVKTNLKILEHEDKTSSGFDYTRFKCEYSDGSTRWMSAFKKTDAEKQCIEDLKNHENVQISVEVRESEKTNQQGEPYLNITKFYGKVVEQDEASKPKQDPEVINPQDFGRKSVKNSAYEKDPVGLSAEIACKILDVDKEHEITGTEAMSKAITMVKQAQNAFS